MPLVKKGGTNKDREAAFKPLCWTLGLHYPLFENKVVLGDN